MLLKICSIKYVFTNQWPDYRQRVDLIQELRFETATTRVKVSPDGDYVIASGN